MSDYHRYVPTEGHSLAHDPLKAIVAPRPIGLISTVNSAGAANLAPYSFLNLVSSKPPIVMFSSEGWKDTVRNIKDTNEFCCDLATLGLAEQVSATGQDFNPGESEFDRVGLTPVACDLIGAPRIADCAGALECSALEVKILTDVGNNRLDVYVVIGQSR